MKLIKFDKIDSTNAYAKQNIDMLEDKSIISADFQTAGYGRFTRSWVDLGTENIYMTFVLKPSDVFLQMHANLTQYLSVCLCKLLEEMGLNPTIKWPNDVLLNGKKVCGILAEATFRGATLKGIALGIGVNLNASEHSLRGIDRPATSLNQELGHDVDKDEFLQKLVDMFFSEYDELLYKGFANIKDYYESHASFLNQNVKVAVFDKIKEGVFYGFDSDGTLLLKTSDGQIDKINMGELV